MNNIARKTWTAPTVEVAKTAVITKLGGSVASNDQFTQAS